MGDTIKKFKTPVFIYDDYVDYLQAWYSYQKRFSLTQREFLLSAGIKAHAFLSDIIARRKKIGRRHIEGFIKALDLKNSAADYFRLLCLKTIARQNEQKEVILKQLTQLRRKHLSSFLTEETMEYYASWKYPVVREYVVMRGEVHSPKDIVNDLVILKLTSKEVDHCLKKLVKWGILIYDKERKVYSKQIHNKPISYTSIPHGVVKDVKSDLITASLHALENFDVHERNISLTICGISEKKYLRLCEKIDELRKEFISDDDDGEKDRVLALSIQAFPVMKVGGRNGEENEDSDDE